MFFSSAVLTLDYKIPYIFIGVLKIETGLAASLAEVLLVQVLHVHSCEISFITNK